MRGYCQSGDKMHIARAKLHYWEEPPISGTRGSGTIFFTGCSLRCAFCQNSEISGGSLHGKDFTVEEFIETIKKLETMGAHNINLVTPTHFASQIAEALRIYKPRVPVVYNCGGYESVETLRMLEGLVDIYLPDFKYADDDLAVRLSNAPHSVKRRLLPFMRWCDRRAKMCTTKTACCKRASSFGSSFCPATRAIPCRCWSSSNSIFRACP